MRSHEYNADLWAYLTDELGHRIAQANGGQQPIVGAIEGTHADVTPAQVRQWAVDELNELWAPYAVEFVRELPLTDVGKVDKKALRARRIAGATG